MKSLRVVVALVVAGTAAIAIAETCRTDCQTYGQQTICTTRCSDGRTCTETCFTYGSQVQCSTRCN